MGISRVPLGSAPAPPAFLGLRRSLTCWQVLSVALSVVSSMFAFCFLLQNYSFFRNVDDIVEHCTVDWESYYPCHFLHLWWTVHDRDSIYDLRCFLTTLFLFVIAVSSHYIFAAVILVTGVARQNHLSLIPWLVVKAFIIICVSALVMAEVYITGGSLNSRYFMLAVAMMLFCIFNWMFGLVAFTQIRKVNLHLQAINSLNYIRFSD